MAQNSVIQVSNNTAHILNITDFGYADTENHSLQHITIDSLPASGTLTLNTNAVATGDSITAASIASGALAYNPTGNAALQDTINFTVTDTGGTLNGGTDTSNNSAQLTITTLALNSAPIAINNTLSIDEDNAHVFSTGDFGFSDPQDQNNFQDLLISSINGDGTLSYNGVPIGPSAIVPAADIANGQLVFNPTANTSGNNYATVEFTVRDDGGTLNGGQDTSQTSSILTINVAPVNDAPIGSDNTITTSEDTQQIINISDFGFSDVSDSDSLLGITITSIDGNGTLQLNGSPVSVDMSITSADISSGQLIFLPDVDTSGTSYASFGFQLTDTGGTLNGGQDTSTPRLLTIDVVSVNDEPSGADGHLTTTEDTPRTIDVSDFGFTDADNDQFFAAQITSGPASGSLQLAGQAVIDGDVINTTSIVDGDLIYVPAVNDSGITSFSFAVIDDGSTANNGRNTDSTDNIIQITVLPVNDAPIGAESSVFAIEDNSYQFSLADFSYSDPVEAHSLQSIMITTLPADGELTNNCLLYTSPSPRDS